MEEDQHEREKNSHCLAYQIKWPALDGPTLGLDIQSNEGLGLEAQQAKDDHVAYQASTLLAQISPAKFKALISRKGVASLNRNTKWKCRARTTASN